MTRSEATAELTRLGYGQWAVSVGIETWCRRESLGKAEPVFLRRLPNGSWSWGPGPGTTATVELTRDAAYAVVVFRTLWAALPEGLYEFASATTVKTPRAVGLRLPKDAAGRVETLPMEAACDFLRDRGWEVVPLGWCAGVLGSD